MVSRVFSSVYDFRLAAFCLFILLAPASVSSANGIVVPVPLQTLNRLLIASLDDDVLLEENKPIEREILGGQSHSYQVKMSLGQYARVLVRQKGFDVEVPLFGPDGQLLMKVDGGGIGVAESVHWIAETAGTYRLEVHCKEGSPTGRYRVELLELGVATEESRIQVAAAKAAAEGDRVYYEQTKAAREASIKKYEEALTLYRKLPDRDREATMLYNIGFVHRSLGDMQKALTYYNDALLLMRAGTNRGEEAATLHDIGSVHLHLGDLQTALEFFSKALPMRIEAGDKNGEAITLNDIGVVHRQRGELQKAIEYYNRVLPLRRALGDERGEGVTLHNIGVVHQSLGEWEMSLDRYNQAIFLFREIPDDHAEAASLNRAGDVYRSLGDLTKARESYDRTLLLRQRVGDKRGEAYTLDSIGVVYRDLGEPRRAMDYYDKALPLRRTTGDRRGETYTLNNIGDAYRDLGDLQKASDYYDRALGLSREISDRGGEARTHRNIAFVDRARGEMEKARAGIEKAIALVESLRSETGGPENRYSFLATVYDYYEFYTDLLMSMHASEPKSGYDLAAFRVSEQARARSLLELLAEAHTSVRQNVDPQLVERERSINKRISARLDDLTKLLTGKHSAEQKLAAEREIETVKGEQRAVQAEIRRRSPRYAALTEPTPLAAGEIQQQLLDDNTVLLQYALGNKGSYLWMVTRDSVLSYRLPPKAEVEEQARRVYQLLTARQGAPGLAPAQQRTRELESDAEYETQANILSRILLGPVYRLLKGKRLLIVADGALQYIPFAALPVPADQVAGVSGLRPGKSVDLRPLIIEHEIVSLPSASVLAVLRRESGARAPASKMVAVLADPVFRPDDARVKQPLALSPPQDERSKRAVLPSAPKSAELERALRSVSGNGGAGLRRLLFSRDEADAILAVTPRSSGFKALDFQANRALVLGDELSQYRVIHFATHGLINSRNPELSGLVLSLVNEAGEPQEGFLRLHEIYNMRLNADLVVLSACQTGLGKEVRGEGLIGLTRGFMYAGAPRVVASLWQVDDAATAALMKEFYRWMLVKKLTAAAALRAAQIEMLKKKGWRSPYYWGAFVLQGEWR